MKIFNRTLKSIHKSQNIGFEFNLLKGDVHADLLKLRFNFQNVFEMGAGAVKV